VNTLCRVAVGKISRVGVREEERKFLRSACNKNQRKRELSCRRETSDRFLIGEERPEKSERLYKSRAGRCERSSSLRRNSKDRAKRLNCNNERKGGEKEQRGSPGTSELDSSKRIGSSILTFKEGRILSKGLKKVTEFWKLGSKVEG